MVDGIATEPAPGPNDEISLGGQHPSQPSIMDFHFDKIMAGEPVVFNRSSTEEVAYTIGPARLMDEKKHSKNPGLRWIHLPFNSMVHTEASCAAFQLNKGDSY